MVERNTLDFLRRQITRRLALNGATQAQLARAVGHTSQWLSMILRGKRGIRIVEIDKIAAFLECPPAALFEDPDLDAALILDASRKAVQHGAPSAHARFSAHVAAQRLLQQREIITRLEHTIAHKQRTIDFFLGAVQPAIRVLEGLDPLESARAEDRRAPLRRSPHRSHRARTAAGHRR
jgi:transcriptional regulator with XRE-family HTH domain